LPAPELISFFVSPAMKEVLVQVIQAIVDLSVSDV
jgi:hypothetical protein